VASNAADTASKNVLLSGTVLRHAAASLDSASIATTATVDFGSQAILHFDDQDVRVHNQGFDALQAQLALTGATITGGAGRFSIVGGFSPVQLGGTGVTYTLHFYPARPNPASGAITFAFELPRAQRASLELYDLSGRRVATLLSGEQPAGRHEISWRAQQASGARLPGGLYLARFWTPGLSHVERVVVLP